MVRAIATVFGIGNIPLIPGTVGSAVGLGLAWVVALDPASYLIATVAVITLGFLSCGRAAKALGKKDPGEIIIDEVAGMMVTVLFLPATWFVYLAGFILFRLWDIAKPTPIRQLERLPGSAGIMLDDIAAGIAANLLLRIGLFVWG